MATKTIRQTVTFAVPPAKVYRALMSSKQHAAFTQSKAVISTKVGGKFSAFDGYIKGKNVELTPGKKIVQTWHASDWPNGHESVVTYSFTPTKTGTKLTFKHEEVPTNHCKGIEKGWKDYYWKPMKKMLEK